MDISVTTFDKKKNKVVTAGEIRDNVFVKKVKPKHFMRVVQGYGVQENVFDKLMDEGIKEIWLIKSNKEKLISNIIQWKLFGKVADYGSGKQRFLSEKYMTKEIK